MKENDRGDAQPLTTTSFEEFGRAVARQVLQLRGEEGTVSLDFAIEPIPRPGRPPKGFERPETTDPRDIDCYWICVQMGGTPMQCLLACGPDIEIRPPISDCDRLWQQFSATEDPIRKAQLLCALAERGCLDLARLRQAVGQITSVLETMPA